MLAQEAESRQKLVSENEKLRQQIDGKSIDTNSATCEHQTRTSRQGKATAGGRGAAANLICSPRRLKPSRALQNELAFLNQNVANERDKAILKLQAERLAQARNEKQAAELDVIAMKNRIQSLNDQLKENERVLAELTNKGRPTTSGVVATGPKGATYRNPPGVYAKGQIDQVDDKGLVKISIGSDAGIRKDQRSKSSGISPKAEFLGWLLVTETDFHYAIGRLLPQPGVATPPLRPGDQVASSLRQK